MLYRNFNWNALIMTTACFLLQYIYYLNFLEWKNFIAETIYVIPSRDSTHSLEEQYSTSNT